MWLIGEVKQNGGEGVKDGDISVDAEENASDKGEISLAVQKCDVCEGDGVLAFKMLLTANHFSQFLSVSP
jgi:hypothetical protein